MAVDGGYPAPLVESPPEEASAGVPPAPVPPVPPAAADTGAIVAPFAGGEDSGAVGTDFTSIFEEIEALGLILVTQGEDDPPPEGLDLGGSLAPPPPPPPCPSPHAVAPALVLGAPLALPISLAVDTTLCEAAKPLGEMADAERLGPGPVGTPSTTWMERLVSPPEGGPHDDSIMPDAVAAGDTLAVTPMPGDGEGPPPALGPGRGEPHPSSSAAGDLLHRECGPEHSAVHKFVTAPSSRQILNIFAYCVRGISSTPVAIVSKHQLKSYEPNLATNCYQA
ncbi:structure-specific endonuclease subunit slx1 [Platysternon megacephalum]|uniref:Structure-specific endonuclease subunit slx1 n=1 Tax=Platysternon megacephalum TaxID=55544 RepID=A0A4D9DKA7_9SAUR|nr:structure-specific endonuclease subunit slx1 [Platysternon megacephalum]